MGDRPKRKRSPLVPEQEQARSDAATAPADAVRSGLHQPDAYLTPRPAVDAAPPGLAGSALSTPLSTAFEDAERSQVSVGRRQVDDQPHKGALGHCPSPLPVASSRHLPPASPVRNVVLGCRSEISIESVVLVGKSNIGGLVEQKVDDCAC